jgi:hypothetical protein
METILTTWAYSRRWQQRKGSQQPRTQGFLIQGSRLPILLISVLWVFFDKYSSYNSTYSHKFPSFIKFDHQLIHSVTHIEQGKKQTHSSPSALSKDWPGKFRKTKQGEKQYSENMLQLWDWFLLSPMELFQSSVLRPWLCAFSNPWTPSSTDRAPGALLRLRPMQDTWRNSFKIDTWPILISFYMKWNRQAVNHA